jgi:hypothetical protein
MYTRRRRRHIARNIPVTRNRNNRKAPGPSRAFSDFQKVCENMFSYSLKSETPTAAETVSAAKIENPAVTAIAPTVRQKQRQNVIDAGVQKA